MLNNFKRSRQYLEHLCSGRNFEQNMQNLEDQEKN